MSSQKFIFWRKISVSDWRGNKLEGVGIGGLPKTLRNLEGWPTWNLTFPWSENG